MGVYSSSSEEQISTNYIKSYDGPTKKAAHATWGSANPIVNLAELEIKICPRHRGKSLSIEVDRGPICLSVIYVFIPPGIPHTEGLDPWIQWMAYWTNETAGKIKWVRDSIPAGNGDGGLTQPPTLFRTPQANNRLHYVAQPIVSKQQGSLPIPNCIARLISTDTRTF
ncbi:hypothetical protein CCUS01_06115 [Colletotrichum cuscutae]|uniref:Uncharacterized protein n=1 Tax=Colletotrichum cuscutae TaxID=1209917 RepID=A0AAI9Y0B9_9PEZI|nr:hypothetical protein CCUS01_06115 [Colletotrichum cuscutae]